MSLRMLTPELYAGEDNEKKQWDMPMSLIIA